MRVDCLLRIYKYNFKGAYILKKWAYKRLKKQGVDIPCDVFVGNNLGLPHPYGIVIHPNTVIEDNVRIYQGVTIGRGDIYNALPADDFEGFRICEGAILCSGAKIIGTHGLLTIGHNSIVGANAVVKESVPDETIAGGIPAKNIGKRE